MLTPVTAYILDRYMSNALLAHRGGYNILLIRDLPSLLHSSSEVLRLVAIHSSTINRHAGPDSASHAEL